MPIAMEAPPYVEERLALDYGGWRIPAVLTLPAGGAPASALLLVPGSLFIDVDGNLPFMNARPHAYADLARQLAARGHAVLRYAKTGPGTGSEVTDEAEARRSQHFRSRVEIARVALDSLLARVPAIPVLAGHSEGALVASLLAAEEPRVAGLVSLSGPALRLMDVMREQLPLPPGKPEAYVAFDRVVASLRATGGADPALLAADPMTRPMTQLGESGMRYVSEVDAVDPAEAVGRVRVPLLVVQGGRDPSVSERHAHRLVAARGALPTRLAIFPELQHFYKRVPEGMDPMASFAVDAESDPAVGEAIAVWIAGLR